MAVVVTEQLVRLGIVEAASVLNFLFATLVADNASRLVFIYIKNGIEQGKRE